MYKGLTVINGALLAIMIFLNGALSNKTGIYISTLIYHLIGLILLLVYSFARKIRLANIFRVSPFLLLPGVLSVITIVMNNLVIPKIGVTLASGIALSGQLVMSAFIEHFGLFGKQPNKFKKGKAAGFLMITLGIIIMIKV